MADEKSEPLDLLGDPWRPLKDQRGRKSHRWLKQVAENVAILRAGGSSHEEIADRLGLDPKTLRKYYSRELDNGPALAKSQIDEVMYRKALDGNVSAARYCLKSFEQGKVKAISSKPAAAKPAKLGVKEQKFRAAQNIDGLYATRQPPKSQVQ